MIGSRSSAAAQRRSPSPLLPRTSAWTRRSSNLPTIRLRTGCATSPSRELASWMRPRRGGEGLAVPGLLAPIIRSAVAHLDLGRRTARSDQDRATAAPVLAILGTEADDVEAWLRAGEALQHVLLVAATGGVQAGFLNQPCQVGELRPRLPSCSTVPVTPRWCFVSATPPSALPARPAALSTTSSSLHEQGRPRARVWP